MEELEEALRESVKITAEREVAIVDHQDKRRDAEQQVQYFKIFKHVMNYFSICHIHTISLIYHPSVWFFYFMRSYFAVKK